MLRNAGLAVLQLLTDFVWSGRGAITGGGASSSSSSSSATAVDGSEPLALVYIFTKVYKRQINEFSPTVLKTLRFFLHIKRKFLPMSKENNLNHSVYPSVITFYCETQTLLLQ